MGGEKCVSMKRVVSSSCKRLVLVTIMTASFGWLLLLGCGGESGQFSGNAVMNSYANPSVPQTNNEVYDEIVESTFLPTLQNPLSTFSIDVDTASYTNSRRFIENGKLPPKQAVRLEEFVNYFDYDYPQPDQAHPFGVSMEMAKCPWNQDNHLLRIALKGTEVEAADRPASNLVFLLDVSGSMKARNKLPLVQESLRLLVNQLNGDDRVAIVVYAGASGVVLPSTSINQKQKIINAIDCLYSGGSTNGSAGIQAAYKIACDNFLKNGSNRVILCTDGDFNVGTTSQSKLVELISEKAKSNVFLSVFGFGTGNYNDSTMEKLANKGNGNYGYIDSMMEAHKTFVSELGANLNTIAKDVKIQVDFNPVHVASYRLIGYENRHLETQDFVDDTKDAGEIGAGHRVTAFYEIVPTKSDEAGQAVMESEFVRPAARAESKSTAVVVSLRYKRPDADKSQEFKIRLEDPDVQEFGQASADFKFAASVVSFGMLLRESEFAGTSNLDWVISTAKSNLGLDHDGFRGDFVTLAKKARLLLKGQSGQMTNVSLRD